MLLMKSPIYAPAYERWAPFIARLIFGFQFLLGAYFKIGGHAMEVAQTAAVGWPLPEISVDAAFVVEVIAAVCLIVGYRVRAVAALLAVYVLLLALVFYRHIADPMTMGMFVSHLGFIAGLLYISVYGAQQIAAKPDQAPQR